MTAERKAAADYVRCLHSGAEAIRAEALRQQDKIEEHRRARGPADADESKAGDYVLLRYDDRPPTKLAGALAGPYAVEQQLSHDTFLIQDLNQDTKLRRHRSQLVPYVVSEDEPTPKFMAARSRLTYIVKEIREHKRVTRANDPGGVHTCLADRNQFLVRWEGYGEDHDEWLRYSELRSNPLLKEYVKAHKLRL